MPSLTGIGASAEQQSTSKSTTQWRSLRLCDKRGSKDNALSDTYIAAASLQSAIRTSNCGFCKQDVEPRYQSLRHHYILRADILQGLAETKLTDIAHDPQQRDLWQTYIMRPSMILPKQPTTAQNLLTRLLGSVSVDSLAYAAITLATQGTSSTTLENKDLVELGKY